MTKGNWKSYNEELVLRGWVFAADRYVWQLVWRIG